VAQWYGKYRAFVRDNHDPEGRGRVRMEIPAVLGAGPDRWSDWAWPCLPAGGSPDQGVFFVPQEGATVWAEFEGGDSRYPIMAGVWYGGQPGDQPLEACRTCAAATCLDCEDKLQHADDPEHARHPSGHGHPPYSCQRRTVLYKSETGHTIIVDDKDGFETLELIDRGGQMIRLTSPVRPELQEGNTLARGDRRASEGTQLTVDQMTDSGAKIEIFDLAGQTVVMESSETRTRITITDAAGSETLMDGLGGNIVMRPRNMLIVTGKES
jgi:hypothetical protein